MSLTARVALMSAVVFTATSVIAVHYQQNKERERMHMGVVRDDERVDAKRRQEENLRELQAQERLQRELLKDQPLRSS
ncbi:hypothetical protein RI367_001721 [Sorochytrium milnesiophthora]